MPYIVVEIESSGCCFSRRIQWTKDETVGPYRVTSTLDMPCYRGLLLHRGLGFSRRCAKYRRESQGRYTMCTVLHTYKYTGSCTQVK